MQTLSEQARSAATPVDQLISWFDGMVAQERPFHSRSEHSAFRNALLDFILKKPELAATPNLSAEVRKAVADGLRVDGEESIIKAYKDRETGMRLARYERMIKGLRRLARRSPEILTFGATVVYQREIDDGKFRVFGGDTPKVQHERLVINRGPLVAVYAFAKLVNGEVAFELMDRAEVMKAKEQASDRSQAWANQEAMMWRKTCEKRLLDHVLKMRDSADEAEPIDGTEGHLAEVELSEASPDEPMHEESLDPAPPQFEQKRDVGLLSQEPPASPPQVAAPPAAATTAGSDAPPPSAPPQGRSEAPPQSGEVEGMGVPSFLDEATTLWVRRLDAALDRLSEEGAPTTEAVDDLERKAVKFLAMIRDNAPDEHDRLSRRFEGLRAMIAPF